MSSSGTPDRRRIPLATALLAAALVAHAGPAGAAGELDKKMTVVAEKIRDLLK